MPRATCRCGHELPIPADPSERVKCPGCGARVRIRQRLDPREPLPGDGFIRFFCPCGRRLKVDAASPPPFGKCPDCGVVVPVPATSLMVPRPSGHPESPTEELAASDRDAIERWAAGHRDRDRANAHPPGPAPPPVAAPVVTARPPAPAHQVEPGLTPTMAFTLPPSDRVEVGMRICPQCGQPVHLGAEACRNCGTPVPRR